MTYEPTSSGHDIYMVYNYGETTYGNKCSRTTAKVGWQQLGMTYSGSSTVSDSNDEFYPFYYDDSYNVFEDTS